MGNPDIYYKRAMQELAYCLAFDENNYKLARELYRENSISKLENFISECKVRMNEKLFFYNAGLASQRIFDAAYEEGCDSVNAACGGTSEFEDFIGLPHIEYGESI